MRKKLSVIKRIYDYRQIFLVTKPHYWYDFIKYKYQKKQAIKYEAPEILNFEYLNVNKDLTVLAKLDQSSHLFVKKADEICNEHYSVYSYNPTALRGNWSKDPLTGYEWPLLHYKDVRKITPAGNDIKCPWEMSNLHFLVTLAQACAFTSDAKYESKFFELLLDWIERNPIGKGVNWCSTIFVAIRSINILIAAALFNSASEKFAENFKDYLPILYYHMLFIRDNIEFGFVRENHYLSNITGLKMLARSFPKESEAQKLYKYATTRFREEISYQVLPDGADHEASSCYHGFVLELFLVGLATDYDLLKALNRNELKRLADMTNVLEDFCSFEKFPVIGDNDSGKVVDFGAAVQQKYSLVGLSRHLLGGMESDDEYSLWLAPKTLESPNSVLAECKPGAILHEYKSGGFLYFNNDAFRLLFRAGTIGRKGRGGHGHNDQLSFILDICGRSVIIDPGSYVYERDLAARHFFRSTEIHNAVSMKGKEQNHIYIDNPFRMDNDAKATFDSQLDGENFRLMAKHYGYMNSIRCMCHREIYIDRKRLDIVDTLEGDYRGEFQITFTFAPGITPAEVGRGGIALYGPDLLASMIIPEVFNYQLRSGEYSESYGDKQRTRCLTMNGNKTKQSEKFTIKIEVIGDE